MIRIILILALLLPISCGGSGSSDEGQPELLRIIHAATGFSDLEISVSQGSSSSSSSSTAREEKEDPVSLEASYGNVVDYFAVPEGTVEVHVRETDSVIPALELTPTIDSGLIQTLLLTETSDALTGTFITDDTLDTNNGQFRIRVVNGIGTEVDAYIGFPSADFSDASSLAAAVAFTTASTYIDIDDGQYVVYITRAGSSTIVAETPSTNFESGVRYSIVTFEDSDGGQPYSARVLRDR